MVQMHVGEDVNQAFFTRCIDIGGQEVVDLNLVVRLDHSVLMDIFYVTFSLFCHGLLLKGFASGRHLK